VPSGFRSNTVTTGKKQSQVSQNGKSLARHGNRLGFSSAEGTVNVRRIQNASEYLEEELVRLVGCMV
jgi:hypothetical protein